jgi:hypothetical protein
MIQPGQAGFRHPQHRLKPVKYFLTLLTAGLLFAAAGCVFHENRDRPVHPADSPAGAGVDHGEYPGDLDHGDTMQK